MWVYKYHIAVSIKTLARVWIYVCMHALRVLVRVSAVWCIYITSIACTFLNVLFGAHRRRHQLLLLLG